VRQRRFTSLPLSDSGSVELPPACWCTTRVAARRRDYVKAATDEASLPHSKLGGRWTRKRLEVVDLGQEKG
jgi:hypothetical protein